MKRSNVGKMLSCLVVLLLVLSSFGYSVTYTHTEIQSVDEYGDGNHPDLLTDNKVTVEGIILNRSDFMLDAEPNQYFPGPGAGAMWQIYIQGEGDDHAGTAVWMGQCYDHIPFGDGIYSDPNWLNEIYCLNHDPCTGYEFAPGDRVRVTGLLKSYKGKTNINEHHDTDPANNLTIELVEAGVGLPQPEVIDLNDVKYDSGPNFDEYIFDANRLTGCEYYQARLVRISDVNIVNPENWGPDYTDETETITIKDTNGLTFPVKLGIGYGFSRFSCPTGQIDIVGIFDQEPPAPPYPPDPKSGYRIWVPNYDGNGKVLTDRGYARYNLPGEINRDGKVDFIDFAWLADNWLECVPGTGACGGGTD